MLLKLNFSHFRELVLNFLDFFPAPYKYLPLFLKVFSYFAGFLSYFKTSVLKPRSSSTTMRIRISPQTHFLWL